MRVQKLGAKRVCTVESRRLGIKSIKRVLYLKTIDHVWTKRKADFCKYLNVRFVSNEHIEHLDIRSGIIAATRRDVVEDFPRSRSLSVRASERAKGNDERRNERK